jgi:Ca-activated chloride channel family protein
MRKILLTSHVMLSAALLLAACGAEPKQAASESTVATEEQQANARTSTEVRPEQKAAPAGEVAATGLLPSAMPGPAENFAPPQPQYLPVPQNTETYAHIGENPIKSVSEAPVSTFSIDVDTGSYANLRRFLMNGQKPPADAVRVEEMLNYFSYDYEGPRNSGIPFRADADVMTTPWNPHTKLLRLAIKGYEPDLGQRPAANLVFLIDVSGSMQDVDKLPLLKAGMKMLVDQLTPEDKVTIVTYAGAAGLALPPTSGDRKEDIRTAIDALEAGGSTAGGEGIELAYAEARAGKIDGGINRILLATDGDFNVGVTDLDMLKTMIEENRKSGIALSTLGFGEGNYNDALMEQLADVGNGNYGYIDSLHEAKRQLVDGLQANLQTIAKDVKVQIEFNPAVIAEYRLIGYENRALAREDFNNDRKDAGEIGAGHSVTALYEIALVGSKGLSVDPLRYQDKVASATPMVRADEFALLRLRYKAPDGDVSRLIETPLQTAWLMRERAPAPDDNFAAAVAAFGQYLKGADRLGNFTLAEIATLARAGRGEDVTGERAEFINLVELTDAMGGS